MTNEPTFEEARAELERIVAKLESGDAGLEEALDLWERGEALYHLCVSKLDKAQGRVEELAAAGGASEQEPPTDSQP